MDRFLWNMTTLMAAAVLGLGFPQPMLAADGSDVRVRPPSARPRRVRHVARRPLEIRHERPHSSTLVRMFDAPSHARYTPPSWATESSPYSPLPRARGPDGGCARRRSDLLQEFVEDEAAQRLRRARVAGEERALDDLGQVDEGEHGTVEIGEVRREGAPLLWSEGLHGHH